MDSEEFIFLKDFDFNAYFGVNEHTLRLDNSQWKGDEIWMNLKEALRAIKWSSWKEVAVKIIVI